jgi:hypothetical protein
MKKRGREAASKGKTRFGAGRAGSDHREQIQQTEVENREQDHGDGDGGVLAIVVNALEVHDVHS